MIAFRWDDIEKRICYVRGVEPQHNLFNSGILNTEKPSKYSVAGAPSYVNFNELSDIVRARVTMLTLVKDEGYVEGVGFNSYNSIGMQHSFVYICEEE